MLFKNHMLLCYWLVIHTIEVIIDLTIRLTFLLALWTMTVAVQTVGTEQVHALLAKLNATNTKRGRAGTTHFFHSCGKLPHTLCIWSSWRPSCECNSHYVCSLPFCNKWQYMDMLHLNKMQTSKKENNINLFSKYIYQKYFT